MEKLTEVDWKKFKKSPFHSKKEEPKQETLEEIAEKEYRLEADPQFPDNHEHKEFLRIFKKGAKCQAGRSYSEEEVLELLIKMNYWSTSNTGKIEVINWFEQFKKK